MGLLRNVSPVPNTNQTILVTLSVTALACGSARETAQSDSGLGIAGRTVATSNVSNACTHSDSLAVSRRHIRILAAMFATDINRHHTTFGFPPPDPSDIKFLSDQETCTKAYAAVDSLLTKWAGPKIPSSAQKPNLYVYRASDLYAVIDPDMRFESTSDLAHQFIFFDSRWKYLGQRAQ